MTQTFITTKTHKGIVLSEEPTGYYLLDSKRNEIFVKTEDIISKEVKRKIRFLKKIKYKEQEIKVDGILKIMIYNTNNVNLREGEIMQKVCRELSGKAFTMIGEPTGDTQRVLTLWEKDRYDCFLLELEVPIEFLDYKRK